MTLTNTGAWIMLGIGIFCFAIAILFVFLLLRFREHKKFKKETFNVMSSKIKLFEFWQYYAFVIVIFTASIAGVVLLGISISTLIK